jgi:hypothetical protein
MGEISSHIQAEVDPVSGKTQFVWVSGNVEQVRSQLLADGAVMWQEKAAASAKRGILAASGFAARVETSGQAIEPG